MNVNDLMEEMRNHGFEDTPPNQLLGFINDAYWDICSRAPWPFLVRRQTIALVAGDPIVPLTDVSKVQAFVNADTSIRLQPLELDEMTGIWSDGLTETGEPYVYYWVGEELRVHPIPDQAYNVVIAYVRIPTALVSANDVPLVPERHHRMILWGALVSAYLMEDDPDLAANFENKLDKRLALVQEDLWAQQYDRPRRIFMYDAEDGDDYLRFYS